VDELALPALMEHNAGKALTLEITLNLFLFWEFYKFMMEGIVFSDYRFYIAPIVFVPLKRDCWRPIAAVCINVSFISVGPPLCEATPI
jgi:hypothetical protein